MRAHGGGYNVHYNNFVARMDVAPLWGTPPHTPGPLYHLFNNNGHNIATKLNNHWAGHGVPNNAAFQLFKEELAAASNAADVRDAILKVFHSGLGAAPAVLLQADVDNAYQHNIPHMQALVGQARYMTFMAMPEIQAMPELRNLFEARGGHAVKTALIAHWGTLANKLPTQADIIAMRDKLATAANEADARKAIYEAIPNAGGVGAIGVANCPLDVAMQTAGVLDAGGTENTLRGQARYQAFIARDEVKNIPVLLQVLQDGPVSTALMAYWSIVGNNPPANIDVLRTALSNPANNSELLIRTAVNNALGNPAGLAAALDHVNTLANGQARVNTLRGEARYAAFIARPEVQSMSTLLTVLKEGPVSAALITAWGAAGPDLSVAIDLTALRSALSDPANNTELLIRTAVDNALGNPAGLAVALDHVNTLANGQARVNTLRGEARYAAFVSMPGVQAMDELKRMFEVAPPHPSIKSTLIIHWGNFANPLPDANAVTKLRDDLAAASDNKKARKVIREAIPGVGILPALPRGALNEGLKTVLAAPGGEDVLRAQARYDKFINIKEIKDIPALQTLFDANLGGAPGAVKAALLAHWGAFGNPIPDAATIKQLRDDLAAAPDHVAVRQAIATAFNLPGLDALMNQPGGIQVGAAAGGLEDKLRGEARYAKFLADNAKQLAMMPKLSIILNASDIRDELRKLWGTGAHTPPVDLTKLCDDIIKAKTPAEVQAAIVDELCCQNIPALAAAKPAIDPKITALLNARILTSTDVDDLKNEAHGSKMIVDPIYADTESVKAKRSFRRLDKAIKDVNASDTPANRTALQNELNALEPALLPSHPLKKPLKALADEMTKPAAPAPVAGLAPPPVGTYFNQNTYERRLSAVTTIANDLREASNSIVNTLNVRVGDRGLDHFVFMAERYNDEVQKLIVSLSSQDRDELDRLLRACRKMDAELTIAQGDLLAKPAGKNTRKALDGIQKTRAMLMETTGLINTSLASERVERVGYFSENSRVLSATQAAGAGIENLVRTLLKGAAAAGGIPGAAGSISASASKLRTTSRFDDGGARVNNDTLKAAVPVPAGAPAGVVAKPSLEFVSVQDVHEGVYKSRFFVSDLAEFNALDDRDLVKQAVKEVENWERGLTDKTLYMELGSGVPPRFAEAISEVCFLLGKPAPLIHGELPERSKKEMQKYSNDVYGYLHETKGKRKGAKPNIYAQLRTLGFTQAEKQTSESVTRTSPTHVPLMPRGKK
jgi:hypothetical protein